MRRPLTVLQLLPALESGGVERSTLEIAQALVGRGDRALVVSAGGRLLPALEATGARHVALDIGRKSPATLRHVAGLRALLLRERVDIVHARSRLPAWMGRLALHGLPAARRPHFVTTVHGLNSPSRYSAVMAGGERVICVSATVRDHVLRHYPATDPARLRVVPRGIDPDAFAPARCPDTAARTRAATQHPALAGDGPLLLLPGRGTRLKGHVDALTLLAGLRAGGDDVRLWMPGALDATRAAYVAELQAAAHALGVADVVAITAPTSAIADAYAASDLVLQLSRRPEAFGRTVIEALSVGRAVVGWDHGGVGELLRELYPAGAVAACDADALATRVRSLLQQPPMLPATMRTAAGAYTLVAMQDATLTIYDEFRNATAVA